mgnify:CR=1 FL=1
MRFLLRLQNYLLPLAVLLLGVALQLGQPYPVEFIRNLVFDQYNRWQPRVETNDLVVFVDIDEASLKAIGQFPWPRSVFAELVRNMSEDGSAAIAFDVLFTEPDRTTPSEILPVWNMLRRGGDAQTWANLQADIKAQISSPDVDIGGIQVQALEIPHPGGAHALKAKAGGKSFVYATDTEHSIGEPNQSLIEFLRNADMSVYDCSFDDGEFERRRGWGHSTWQEGLRLAEAAEVKKFGIFHHEPERSDAALTDIETRAQAILPHSFVTRDYLHMEV